MARSSPRYSILFIAALIVGASYWLWAPPGVSDPAAHIAWKGSSVALFALWAALNTQGRDGWQLVAVLALGALGDVLIELDRNLGAGAFLAGHVVATAFYWRHRRAARRGSQTMLAAMLLIGTPVIAFLLPADRAGAPLVAIYALGLGAMAGSAWASAFPRYRVGFGAVLFVASDLLIFAQMGPLAGSPWPGRLIWPIYLAGQALIAWGGVTTLLHWENDDDLHHRL